MSLANITCRARPISGFSDIGRYRYLQKCEKPIPINRPIINYPISCDMSNERSHWDLPILGYHCCPSLMNVGNDTHRRDITTEPRALGLLISTRDQPVCWGKFRWYWWSVKNTSRLVLSQWQRGMWTSPSIDLYCAFLTQEKNDREVSLSVEIWFKQEANGMLLHSFALALHLIKHIDACRPIGSNLNT